MPATVDQVGQSFQPVSRDKRYTVTVEFCGNETPMYVARFCGDWIGASRFKSSAFTLAIGESQRRAGALVIEGN